MKIKDGSFKKSSCSQPGGIITRCVLVARTPKKVAVRNSRDKSKRTLEFTHQEWQAFIGGVKLGEFEV